MLLKIEHGVNNFFRDLGQEVKAQDRILKSHKLQHKYNKKTWDPTLSTRAKGHKTQHLRKT